MACSGSLSGLRQASASLALLLFLMTLSSVAALYEEQAGKYDWIKQHVGDVKIARFGGENIFIASKIGAIAALNNSDGSLTWRVVLDQDQEVTALEMNEEVVFAVTATAHLRAFNAKNGQLMWESWIADETGAFPCRAGIAVAQQQLIVACDGFVASYDANSGRRSWKTALAVPGEGAPSVSSVFVRRDKKATIAITPSCGTLVRLALVRVSDGAVEAQVAPSASGLDPSTLIALENGAVAVTTGNTKLCAVALGGTTMTCTAVSNLLLPTAASSKREIVPPPKPEKLILYQNGCGDMFVMKAESSSAAAYIIKLEKNSILRRVLGTANGSAGILCSTSTAAAAPARQQAALATATEEGVKVQVLNLMNGDPSVEREAVDASLTRRNVVDGSVVAVSASFVGPNGEVLVQLEEGSLAFFPAEAPDSTSASSSSFSSSWVRQESLAAVNDFLFAELPAPTPENEAQWLSSQPTTSTVLRMELIALKAQVGLASPREMAAVEKYRAYTSDRLRPTRDPDGFRRQLLVATASGKVLALHTSDGRVLWSLDFGKTNAPVRLAPWQTPHDFQHDAFIVAFRPSGADLVAVVINTHTGQVESSEVVENGATVHAEVVPLGLSSSLLHGVDSSSSSAAAAADQHMFAVIDPSTSSVTVLPRTDAARAAFAKHAKHIVRWRISDDRQSLSGFRIDASGVEKVLWTVVAAPKDSGLRITSVASRDVDEQVYSAARPIPGGGILLKHLSPNTLLVIASPPPDAKLSKASSRIVATLLDAASGQVLVSQINSAAAGPVHAVTSEHWAAYHFWSLETERWHIAVLDGYHPSPPQLSVIDLALDRPAAANATATTTTAAVPTFERQIFTTRLPAVTLSVTKTAHGTTAKMMLIGTPSGQVYMMDRRMLDPRRPLVPPGSKPTPQQSAEGLPPYQPEIAITGQMFATLNHRVARLNKVVTVPAMLESSSLMVAVGLDLFYTRLQPSRGFDMVPDDFPHALLVAMVGGMGVALVVLRAVLQKRALKLKWQ